MRDIGGLLKIEETLQRHSTGIGYVDPQNGQTYRFYEGSPDSAGRVASSTLRLRSPSRSSGCIGARGRVQAVPLNRKRLEHILEQGAETLRPLRDQRAAGPGLRHALPPLRVGRTAARRSGPFED
jgi:hypothetical protein